LSARSAPRVVHHGRWPRATGLAFYPSSCVVDLQAGDHRWSVPPAFGSCCRASFGHRLPGASRLGDSLRDGPFPLRVSGCETGTFRRHQFSSRTVRSDPPHWLTVATSGVPTDCVHRTARNRGSTASLGWRLVSRAHATCLIVSRFAPARRLVPLSHDGEVRPPPQEPVTSASGPPSTNERQPPRGRERQFVPTIRRALTRLLSRGSLPTRRADSLLSDQRASGLSVAFSSAGRPSHCSS
jgi:hypothetical protein